MSSTNTNNETPPPDPPPSYKFVDVGANLLDPMYKGIYRDKPRHDPDLPSVLSRSWSNHVDRIVITCGSLRESRDGLKLARTDPRLFCTVGVHPTRCREEFGETEEEEKACVDGLREVIEDGRRDGSVVALGELGLDYARTQFCDVETQKRGLRAQLKLAEEFDDLPLFLHNRDTGTDLLEILSEHFSRTAAGGTVSSAGGGVVHSFDDTLPLAQKFLSLGLHLGINGCSLRTPSNLSVVRSLPLDRLLLETDGPWCGIKASHAGFEHVETRFETRGEKKWEEGCCMKGRCEPCHVVQVAEVMTGVMGVGVREVA